MTPEEARREALRCFGSPAAVRDRTLHADVFVLADDFRQDVTCAIRGLRRRPGLSMLALLTLAIGLGATTAIFTVVRSVLLRPLPFSHPEALHAVAYGSPGPGPWGYPGTSDRGYVAFREANRTFRRWRRSRRLNRRSPTARPMSGSR